MNDSIRLTPLRRPRVGTTNIPTINSRGRWNTYTNEFYLHRCHTVQPNSPTNYWSVRMRSTVKWKHPLVGDAFEQTGFGHIRFQTRTAALQALRELLLSAGQLHEADSF